MNVRINKVNNLDYPPFIQTVDTNVTCEHQTLYSLSGVRFPDFENWPVTVCTVCM
jgi:hypothetical protein